MSRELVSASNRPLYVRVTVVAASMLATALYLTVASRAEEVPPREPIAGIPMKIDGWIGRREPDFTQDILDVLGVDDYITRTYSLPGEAVLGLYVGYHTSQRQGDTIHSPLNCIPGAGWQPLEQGRIVVPVQTSSATGHAAPIEVNRVIIAKGLDRQLVLYWYQSHRRVVANEYWGKVYTVLDSIRYNRTDAALVRIVTPITDDVSPAEAERRAVSFAQALFPLLDRHFPS